MATRYYRNRIAREMPHGHHCNDCGADTACEVNPCYRPPNAPFSLCDACIAKTVAASLAILDDDPNDDGGERFESWCQGREDGRHRWMDGADFCEYCHVAWEDRNT
jgi:hypothetical protein